MKIFRGILFSLCILIWIINLINYLNTGFITHNDIIFTMICTVFFFVCALIRVIEEQLKQKF